MRTVVVGGVAGSGKSTVGAALARRLDWAHLEGDAFHPPANVAKMASGLALNDGDRDPWLTALATAIEARSIGHVGGGAGTVVSASALKRVHRRRLRSGRGDVAIVLLHGPTDLLEARLHARRGHFFPTRLLASQLETLELPEPDEAVLVADAGNSVDTIVDRIVTTLGLRPR